MFRYLIIMLLFFYNNIYANILQNAIDNAPANSILKLPAGIYEGNINISKPLSIVAKEDGVVIKGDGDGNVISISASGVKLKNLKIINSGKRRDMLDAAIYAKNITSMQINNCIVEKSHIGVFLENVSNSKILNSTFISKDKDIDLRGDGLRLWFSHNNIIKNNKFISIRDVVMMRSNSNNISNNIMRECRYSVFSYHSKFNFIKNNDIKNSSVGIYIEGSLGTKIRKNIIKGKLGSATSMGILLKATSDARVSKNSIGECNQAFYIDNSPMKVGTKNYIFENKIMYSTRGLDFRGFSLKNVIQKNILHANMDNIMTDSHKGRTNENTIQENYWDDYEGFDLNSDNIGDTSYIKYLYFDQIWVKNPKVRFFYGSPVVSMINFMLKVAPFMEPIFLIEDSKPIYKIDI